ncbi:MAG: copper resistance protein NlpE [Alistipes sp.]|nr:copper resistance protein NlpE [Alistipes sp.]
MNRLIFAIIFSLLAGSCGQNAKKITDTNVAAAIDHASQKEAADYRGTYHGTIPCADCDGIEVTLWIKEGGQFELKTRHIAPREGMDDIHTQYEGKYKWDAAGNMITLQNITTQPNKYLYHDGMLIQLDINGNRIQGPLADRYVLRK